MQEDRENQVLTEGVRDALSLIPGGMFIMTAAHDNRAAGVCVSSVQVCALDPPLVAVAMLRGQSLEPHIRDSRCFALCQINADDLLLQQKFAPNERATHDTSGWMHDDDREEPDDPFVSIAARCAPSGSPIVERALAWLDCELVRCVDIDTDHRIYVGRVIGGGVAGASPSPRLRNNGAK